ncbi:MAG: GNAT family N-acetyltransferase [Rhodoplanes sp.]|uniref:GNAT family N-acetyltransferase n=1 Tax=Rhodoplanes sp. TaxID=1968906 RepID=UPI0017C00352|nr:GNAT family N-acetyltransferase [Rhodoplanes sp.]NVO14608.1 GNAT family N-acetyltransferase [Rhodoplanes sp.]
MATRSRSRDDTVPSGGGAAGGETDAGESNGGEAADGPPLQAAAIAVRSAVRLAVSADLDALVALEQAVFATDRMSRQSIRRFLSSPSAVVLVARTQDDLAGAAVLLVRNRSTVARLYSIAVDPRAAGRGVGPALLEAVESSAAARGATRIRLEVHEHNARAIARYHKAGYRQFGRHARYYEDQGDALRFEKMLAPPSDRGVAPVARPLP